MERTTVRAVSPMTARTNPAVWTFGRVVGLSALNISAVPSAKSAVLAPITTAGRPRSAAASRRILEGTLRRRRGTAEQAILASVIELTQDATVFQYASVLAAR